MSEELKVMRTDEDKLAAAARCNLDFIENCGEIVSGGSMSKALRPIRDYIDWLERWIKQLEEIVAE